MAARPSLSIVFSLIDYRRRQREHKRKGHKKVREFVLAVILLGLLLPVIPNCGTSGSDSATTPASSPQATVSVIKTSPTPQTITPAPSETEIAATEELAALLSKTDWEENFSVDIVASTPRDGQLTVRLSSQKDRQAMKLRSKDQEIQVILDYAKKEMLMFNAKEKLALKLPLASGNPLTQQTGFFSPVDILKEVPPGARYAGTETIDGRQCAVYEYSSRELGSARVWIWKDKGFPLKLESTNAAGKTTAEFKNLMIGSVDQSMFSLPPGTQVQDLSALLATPTPTKK